MTAEDLPVYAVDTTHLSLWSEVMQLRIEIAVELPAEHEHGAGKPIEDKEQPGQKAKPAVKGKSQFGESARYFHTFLLKVIANGQPEFPRRKWHIGIKANGICGNGGYPGTAIIIPVEYIVYDRIDRDPAV